MGLNNSQHLVLEQNEALSGNGRSGNQGLSEGMMSVDSCAIGNQAVPKAEICSAILLALSMHRSGPILIENRWLKASLGVRRGAIIGLFEIGTTLKPYHTSADHIMWIFHLLEAPSGLFVDLGLPYALTH